MTDRSDRREHPDRRDRVADAAIAVLAARGPGVLTHRAVDAEAGLPVGSTSNVARTKDQLIDLAWRRLAALDAPWVAGEAAALRAVLASRGTDAELDPDALGAVLAPRLAAAARERRELTRARIALDAMFATRREAAEDERARLLAGLDEAMGADAGLLAALVVAFDGWLRREALAPRDEAPAALAERARAMARILVAGLEAARSSNRPAHAGSAETRVRRER